MKREHNLENIPFYENLVFYAPLTDGNTDLVGSKTATEYGSVTYSEEGALMDNSCIEYPLPYSEQISPITLYSKMKMNNIVNAYDYIVTIGSLSNSNTYRCAYFLRKTDNRIGFDIAWSSNRYDIESYTNVNTVQGRWYEVVMVLGANFQKIYVDKVLQYSNNATDNYSITGTQPGNLMLGCRANASVERRYHGYLKDVRIYNMALSEQEIEQL